MAAFLRHPGDSERIDYRLLRRGSCHLYWRISFLDEDSAWLARNGYRVVQFDARKWSDEGVLHDDFSIALSFPGWYGGNLNALNDCLSEVCSEASPYVALRFDHFDDFARRYARVAHDVLDIIEGTSRRGLLFGDRLLALVQSDDPNLLLEPVGAVGVGWNPREWLKSSRQVP